ncbi:MAG: hypothetical protein KDB14_27970 [Planctomycetales bacterium]|nr:hypothetical protein [Planctomycetales bacterium]
MNARWWLTLLVVLGAATAARALLDRGQREAPPTPALQPESDGAFHVRPGESIQAAVDAAAASATKRVVVHEGVYRPQQVAQALVRFNRQHDGVVLEASGNVELTAANPELHTAEQSNATPDPAAPAVVNHVVYFGDGVTSRTTLRGFTITGANGFVATDELTPPIEPTSLDPRLKKGLFFYADGGAIKVFGRSSPTLEQLVIRDNRTMICGAGVSVEQRGYLDQPVVMRDIRFLNNACPATGAAVDLLGGSAAVLENCLFEGNIGNTGMDRVAEKFNLSYHSEHGCGALTVFPESRALVRRCTFRNNWNGADDQGAGSVYLDCIFWGNDRSDGTRPKGPYELDVTESARVEGCWFGSAETYDLRGTIDGKLNRFDAPDPQFDEHGNPQNPVYRSIGYRFAESATPLSP